MKDLIESDKSSEEVVNDLTSESKINEVARPDPFSDFADKVRSMAMNKPSQDWKKGRSSGSSNSLSPREIGRINQDISQAEDDLNDLKRRYRDLLFELEQKAEPEGGSVADRIAKEMEDLENKIDRKKKEISSLYSKLNP